MQPSVAHPDPRVSTSRMSLGRLAEPVRDIARSGLAGLFTGILVAGVGGRIVMRVAALRVPEAAGRLTDNGNAIGEITLSGTVALVLVGALFFGLLGATLWVVVSPWIPGGGRTRAMLAMPIAVSFAGIALIQARNPDFAVLRHDAVTVGLLLALVALAGLAIAIFDGWLDDHLPAASASTTADAIYLALALAGAGLILPIVLGLYLFEETALGVALVACGGATLIHWTRRFQRRSPSPRWLVVAGRGSLFVAAALGLLALGPDVALALGLR
jgi:hypothetical protein